VVGDPETEKATSELHGGIDLKWIVQNKKKLKFKYVILKNATHYL
jgi:hypothetical protein